MRVLVCGGRDFNNYPFLRDSLDRLLNPNNLPLAYEAGIEIIHGGAKGADSWADFWAVHNYCPIQEYKANWSKYGKAAGYIRNKQMLDEGHPDLVIAFPGGAGTANMIKLAKDAGVKVIEVEYHESWTNCKTCGKYRDNTYGCYC